MTATTRCFRACSKLFVQHALGDMLKSNEYNDIDEQLDSILLLSDRVLAAFIEDREFGRISKIADLLKDINATVKNQSENISIFEELLQNTELWLKLLLWLVDPAKSTSLKSNPQSYTLFPCIRELGLLTQAELDTKENDVKNISDEVRILIYWNRKDRNYLTHATYEIPDYIKARFPSVALITLLAPVYKHQEVIKAKLQGLITNPFPEEANELIAMVASEKKRHLEHFNAREKWVNKLSEYLKPKPDSSKPYLLLSGYEGIGKSALVSKLTDELSKSNASIGHYAGSVRKLAPWLPDVILHFGKQSNHPTTIVRSLIAQANTLLLEPEALPEYETNKSHHEWSEKRAYSPLKRDTSQEDGYDESDRYQQDINNNTITDIKQYRQLLYLIFEKIAQEHGAFVLIIDALDEISSDGTTLDFLPERLPNNVSALLTARQNTPVINWLKSNRDVTSLHLDELEKEEIHLITHLEPENSLNSKIWEASKGWPLLVVETAKYIHQNDKPSDKIPFYDKADSVFDRQTRQWKDINEVLQLLSIFEPAIPIDLVFIQSYLEFKFKNRYYSQPELRGLLSPIASQIEGLEIGQVKLALKAFAEYVRERYWSTIDLERILQSITEWLSENEEVNAKVVAEFLKYWTDSSQVKKPKLCKVAALLVDRLIKNRSPDFLFDVYRYAQEKRNKRDKILSFAASFLEAAAVNRHVKAMRIFGSRLVDGRGLDMDKEKGEKWLIDAANSGDVDSMLNYAMRLINGYGVNNDVILGEKLIRKAAENGNCNAQNLLANLLLNGNQISRNSEEGEELLRRLSEEGNEEAIYVLASRLLDGKGLDKNADEGEYLLQELVDNGNKKAIFTMARRLLEGNGLEQNISKGYSLLENLAKSGSISAMIELGTRLMDGRNIPQQIDAGQKWLQKAIDADSKDAMRIMANRLLDGKNINQNIQEGQRLLYAAANADDSESMLLLGDRLIKGEVLTKNLKQGEAWLKKSAETGNDDAMFLLGSKYLEGNGLHKKPAQGAEWLRKSAEEGNIDAMYTLGTALLDGDHLKQDISKGKKWLSMALSKGSKYAAYALALDSYTNNNFADAAKFFLHGHDLGDMDSTNSLAYMARRGEIPVFDELPSITDLFNSLINNNSPFGLVNYSLALASGYLYPKDWLGADKIISSLKLVAGDSDKIQQIINWWHKELALKNDAEGHLVIGWLLRHGLSEDPDKLSLIERLRRAREGGWDVPEWMESIPV
ncbi:SEL1-like repeat protein [Methylomonas sp. LL1]|uniref:AAA family ATPase n=1 Tax=Methylomonas sp. LL1 TaxID=2785785 RepID=UPI0018C3C6B2|nr:AAA family ATPase [Methylomonas sp. LL1]QPK65050.1 SEL1-like repeat protein [Methylomonas sp. LL1]